MPFPLATRRLILRPFTDADLEPFLAYRNHPEVHRYQGWKTPYQREMAEEFIRSMQAAEPGREGQWFQAALELKSTHELIGDVGFAPREGSHGQAHLGVTLARPFWNKGYAVEGITAILDFIFDELSLHRVHADCDTENRGSIRLLERLGFRREAHHVKSYWLGDRWGDEYVYAILEHEWKVRAGQSVTDLFNGG